MNALSLFSGIGGLDLAAEWAGFKTVAFCEQDKFCQQVLRKHWPDVRIYDDVKTLDTSELPAIELVHGGYPCQPFSTAGKRKGAEDKRHLWPDMFRIVRELNPSWVVCENVEGHIANGLDEVCDDLESEGYETQAMLIPACAVESQHIRNRVFIIAYATGERGRRVLDKCGQEKAKNERERGSPNRESLQAYAASAKTGWRNGWGSATRICGVDDGIPNRVDRIKSLGNAVVPQQAYPIFAALAETYNAELSRAAQAPNETADGNASAGMQGYTDERMA